MPNEERTQDFELIELLIREAGSNAGASPSTSTQQGSDFESFKASFQSYIDQIPSYLHSVGKEGFFPHFFLGSFSTLIDTEIAKSLKIKKMYFRFDSGTLKVAVISNDKIQSYEDVKKHVKLISISEHNSDNKNCKFTSGDLVEILKKCLTPPKGKSIQAEAQDIKDAFKGPIDSVLEMDFRLIHISRNNINKEGINVEVIDTRVLNSAVSKGFHEVRGGLWSNPESDIAKLTNPDVKKVKEPVENILKKVSKIHSEYKNSLTYAQGTREAAHHGFVAGVLVNFRYRHNLRVYLEQFAGRGYADIVLVPRGKDRSLNAIPIIIEMKAATKAELKEGKIGEKSKTTPAAALKQAEDYTKGFQPNVMRILTTANDMLCVGVNLDHPSPVSNIVAKSRDQEITPLFDEVLVSINEHNNRKIDKGELKERIQNNIERIYHTFPGTGEKGDNHYFSRFLLGQSLLLNEVKVLNSNFEKHVFIYGENIPTEAQPEPKSQRLKDQKSKGQGAGQPSHLDQSHGAVTMVFIPSNAQKSVCVMNIIETDGRANVMNKGIPLDRLQQEIGERKIVELNLNFNIKKKSKFKEYFSVEVGESVSLEQYNRRETNKFEGNFKDIPYPKDFKKTKVYTMHELIKKVIRSQFTIDEEKYILSCVIELVSEAEGGFLDVVHLLSLFDHSKKYDYLIEENKNFPCLILSGLNELYEYQKVINLTSQLYQLLAVDDRYSRLIKYEFACARAGLGWYDKALKVFLDLKKLEKVNDAFPSLTLDKKILSIYLKQKNYKKALSYSKYNNFIFTSSFNEEIMELIEEHLDMAVIIAEVFVMQKRYTDAFTTLYYVRQLRNEIFLKISDFNSDDDPYLDPSEVYEFYNLDTKYIYALAYFFMSQERKKVTINEEALPHKEDLPRELSIQALFRQLQDILINQESSQYLQPAPYFVEIEVGKVIQRELREKALQYFEKVLKLQKNYGFLDNHPNVLSVKFYIAVLHSCLEDKEKALQELQRLQELQEKVIGINHPDTLDTVYAIQKLFTRDEDKSTYLKNEVEKRESLLQFEKSDLNAKGVSILKELYVEKNSESSSSVSSEELLLGNKRFLDTESTKTKRRKIDNQPAIKSYLNDVNVNLSRQQDAIVNL